MSGTKLRHIVVVLATVMLISTALAAPASASHQTGIVYIQEPYGSQWGYTTKPGEPDHQCARADGWGVPVSRCADVADYPDSSPRAVKFIGWAQLDTGQSLSLSGYIQAIANNNGPTDKLIIVYLYANGVFMGWIGYAHVNPAVSAGQWISSGTSLGTESSVPYHVHFHVSSTGTIINTHYTLNVCCTWYGHNPGPAGTAIARFVQNGDFPNLLKLTPDIGRAGGAGQ